MKLFILIPFIVLGNICVSQTFLPRTNGTFTPVDPYLSVPRAFYLPKVCDTLVNPLHGGKDSVGAMIIDTCNQKIWVRSRIGNAKVWIDINSSISEIHPVNWYNIKNAGADTTGGTDISSFVIAAQAAGRKDIYLPKGTYLISNTVQMKDSVTIRGDGRQSTIIKLAPNTVGFKLGFAEGGFKCQFLDIGFLGTDSTSGNGSQTGILIDSVNGVFVHNVGGYLLGGWTVRIKRNGYCCGTYTTTAPRGNIISDCYSQKCYGGFALDTLAEYNTVNNSTAVNGVYGVFIAGGNSRVNSNNFSSNTYGIYLTGGSNNGHGTSTGNTFNHNTNNVYCTGVTLGFSFVGNMVYAGTNQITFIDCDNVNFNGGDIVGANFTITNCTNTTFNDVRFGTGAITWTITGAPPTIIRNGKTLNTISVIDPVNSNQLDISHTNKIANFTVSSGGRFIFSDTVKTKYLLGSDLDGDSLNLIPTTSAVFSGSLGKIKFGANSAFLFQSSNDRLGIGTTSPDFGSDIHVRRSTSSNLTIQLQNESASASATTRILFKNSSGITTQMFHGNTSNSFAPDGFLIHNSGIGGIRLGAQGGDIVFNQSSIQGVGEYFRLKIGTGSFLFGTTTDDPTKGRFQLHSRVRIDSALRLLNVTEPPSAYNLLVHGLTDSATYQVPVSSLIGNTVYTGDGVLAGPRRISGGVNAYALQVDSSSSISLFSGLEYVSSGVGSFVQMSDSVMNIGSSSTTDFTSITFSPTRIKFTAADGAGSAGNVWTNTGSGNGHWAPAGGIDLNDDTTKRYMPLHVFAGESNPAGVLSNAGLSGAETSAFPRIQMFNNLNRTFEALQIGTNNSHLINSSNTHGWELQLMKSMQAGSPFLTDTVYLVKIAYAGANITQLSTTYIDTAYARMDSAIVQMKRRGLMPQIYFWYSQGINDSGTGATEWLKKTLAYITALRSRYGFFPVYITNLPTTSAGNNKNATINLMHYWDGFANRFDGSALATSDGTHWDSASMATIAKGILTLCRDTTGQRDMYIQSQANVAKKYIEATYLNVDNDVAIGAAGNTGGALAVGGGQSFVNDNTGVFMYGGFIGMMKVAGSAGHIGFANGQALKIKVSNQASNIGIGDTYTDIATFNSNGNAVFGTTNSIVGTATNNNAVAGNIGEYISSTIASGSAVALTTATTANVTSISLTAGDWDVTGVVDYAMTSATATDFIHGVSTTSATLGGQDTYAQKPFAFAGSSSTLGDNTPTTRISIAGTTTVYLVAQATFSGGSIGAYGTIRARRVR